jgi:hypothetical protein
VIDKNAKFTIYLGPEVKNLVTRVSGSTDLGEKIAQGQLSILVNFVAVYGIDTFELDAVHDLVFDCTAFLYDTLGAHMGKAEFERLSELLDTRYHIHVAYNKPILSMCVVNDILPETLYDDDQMFSNWDTVRECTELKISLFH